MRLKADVIYFRCLHKQGDRCFANFSKKGTCAIFMSYSLLLFSYSLHPFSGC